MLFTYAYHEGLTSARPREGKMEKENERYQQKGPTLTSYAYITTLSIYTAYASARQVDTLQDCITDNGTNADAKRCVKCCKYCKYC